MKIDAKHIFFGFLIIASAIGIGQVMGLKQLPSPLFGGDYYHQLGLINYYLEGGNPFLGGSVGDTLPVYMFTYSWIVALFSFIIFADAMTGMIIFSIFVGIASLLSWYWAFHKVFGKNHLSPAIPFVLAGLAGFFTFKYTDFSIRVLLPLLIAMLWEMPKQKKYLVMTGVFLGLFCLSQGVAIFVGFGLLFALFLANFLETKKKHRRQLYEQYGIVAGVGFLIALIYWHFPLVYGITTPEPYFEWNGINLASFSNQTSFVFNFFKSLFFNFNSIYNSVITLAIWAGTFFLFTMKKNLMQRKIYYIFCIIFLGLIHHIITIPILGLSIYPARLTQFFMPLAFFMLLGIFSIFAAKYVDKKLGKKAIYLTLILMVLVVGVKAQQFTDRATNDVWLQRGLTPLDPKWSSLGDYLKDNNPEDKVLLSNNELSFAANAVSGINIVTNRRAHNFPYIDMSERMIDSAIIMYGNDDEERLRLLSKYDVDYFLWSQEWLSLEWQVQNNQIAGYSDPLLVFDTPEARDRLATYNVSVSPINGYVDPALRGEKFLTMNILLIAPYAFDMAKPWNPELDKYLTEEYRYPEQGAATLILYSVET